MHITAYNICLLELSFYFARLKSVRRKIKDFFTINRECIYLMIYIYAFIFFIFVLFELSEFGRLYEFSEEELMAF